MVLVLISYVNLLYIGILLHRPIATTVCEIKISKIFITAVLINYTLPLRAIAQNTKQKSNQT